MKLRHYAVATLLFLLAVALRAQQLPVFRNGSQHEIEVSVEQDGARVRARREVVHRSVDRGDETVEERLRRLFGSPELGRRWRSFEVVR